MVMAITGRTIDRGKYQSIIIYSCSLEWILIAVVISTEWAHIRLTSIEKDWCTIRVFV